MALLFTEKRKCRPSGRTPGEAMQFGSWLAGDGRELAAVDGDAFELPVGEESDVPAVGVPEREAGFLGAGAELEIERIERAARAR